MQIFTGNTEIDTVVEQRLSHIIFARFLRIIPDIWFGVPAIRMEVTGSYILGEHFDYAIINMQWIDCTLYVNK